MISCDRWEADGDPVTLYAGTMEFVVLGSVLSLDCEVMVGWNVATETIRHAARRIDFRGRAIGPVAPLRSLAGEVGGGWRSMELAANGPRVGAIAPRDSACRFVPLDLDGAEIGPAVVLDNGSCHGLSPLDDGFSFIDTAPLGATLRTIDVEGRDVTRTAIPVPTARTWWSRLIFDDGSFLTYQSGPDPMSFLALGWVRRFDARGAPLGDEVALDVHGAPMQFAETRGGVVAAWTTSPVAGRGVGVRALDREGRARADRRSAPAEGAIFGVAVRSTPDGGALLAWQENHTDAPQWRLRVQSLDADGEARSAPSTIASNVYADSWDVIVDGSGARALHVRSRDGIVLEALPLRCAD